jgi:bifunctional non-homologous end joining protein LigD
VPTAPAPGLAALGLRQPEDLKPTGGFRFICRRDGERVRVFSRGGYDWTDRVPRIAEVLAKLRLKSVAIDGEGVACGPDGVTDFDRLRSAVDRMGSRDAFLYAFDLLEINGTDLRREVASVV